jgi:predicted deacylase
LTSIRIGNISCDVGEKKFGELILAEGPITTIKVPIGIINGIKPGRTVCIVAGTHACEYVGIDTAIKVYHDYSPAQLNGTLLILPVINPAAFETMTPYVNPIDGLNMSFMFTGSENGTTTERMCKVILEKAVFISDCVLDLHGGDLNEIMLPSVIAGVTGNTSVDFESMNLARAFGTEYIILHKPEESPSTAAKYNYDTTIESRAAERGIPSIVGEIGANGLSSKEEVDYYFQCVENVLRYLRLVQGEIKVTGNQKAISNSIRVRTSTGGIFTSIRKVGEYLRAGETIGFVTDLKGDLKEEVRTPIDSLLTLLFTKHTAYGGQIVASLTTKIDRLPNWKPFESQRK